VPALWLFLIVFFWTPPHFWALALLIREQYAAAKVPMLPVVRGERETVRQIVLYTVALVLLTLVAGVWLGPLYTVAAAFLGGAFLWLAIGLRRDAGRRRAALVFHFSLAYLALLFVAAALDPVLL
jgi:protoheme IX farnesyltransferase